MRIRKNNYENDEKGEEGEERNEEKEEEEEEEESSSSSLSSFRIEFRNRDSSNKLTMVLDNMKEKEYKEG